MDLVDYQTISYPFIIWRIEVVRVGILAYSATRIGQPLSRTSTDPMLPGDYAAYLGKLQNYPSHLPNSNSPR
jgi:hypothetical protein